MTILKNGVKVVNLCAHELDFDSGDKVAPSGFVLGCKTENAVVPSCCKAKLQVTNFKELMKTHPDTLFVTSTIARDSYSEKLACKSRRLVSPVPVGDRAAKKRASADTFAVSV